MLVKREKDIEASHVRQLLACLPHFVVWTFGN
jgi:hypothetical protein